MQCRAGWKMIRIAPNKNTLLPGERVNALDMIKRSYIAGYLGLGQLVVTGRLVRYAKR